METTISTNTLLSFPSSRYPCSSLEDAHKTRTIQRLGGSFSETLPTLFDDVEGDVDGQKRYISHVQRPCQTFQTRLTPSTPQVFYTQLRLTGLGVVFDSQLKKDLEGLQTHPKLNHLPVLTTLCPTVRPAGYCSSNHTHRFCL
ncbi:hypothetical protein MSAN_01812300 [Mycena sanguinolenta]|uniref:Uncharacterized protein n=1 Tax=Mycena sanguinolenta TaxID=230812 RepID=A0A8H6XRK4_9AGAR|nr:hypothetical protein MSAN_01812300 [Mycena sanguinolenta]